VEKKPLRLPHQALNTLLSVAVLLVAVGTLAVAVVLAGI
jgi:hypothetical protein